MPAAATPLVILGIDPGSVVTGYGVIRMRDVEPVLVTYGAIRPKGSDVIGRVADLYDRVREVIAEFAPGEVAIEEPFSRVNARSAFVLGKAQAAAILAAAHLGIPVFTYSPAEVKQAVTGYGRGSKEQVQEMIRLLLRMPATPQPADAADALAVALCHQAHRRTAALTAGAPTRRNST